MPSKYKTIYIHTEKASKESIWRLGPTVNGDQLARDVQAAIESMELDEYKLYSVTPIVATITREAGDTVPTTEGVMLIFEKEKETKKPHN